MIQIKLLPHKVTTIIAKQGDISIELVSELEDEVLSVFQVRDNCKILFVSDRLYQCLNFVNNIKP